MIAPNNDREVYKYLLDKNKYGLIYFHMGLNVYISKMGKAITEIFALLNALSKQILYLVGVIKIFTIISGFCSDFRIIKSSEVLEVS